MSIIVFHFNLVEKCNTNSEHVLKLLDLIPELKDKELTSDFYSYRVKEPIKGVESAAVYLINDPLVDVSGITAVVEGINIMDLAANSGDQLNMFEKLTECGKFVSIKAKTKITEDVEQFLLPLNNKYALGYRLPDADQTHIKNELVKVNRSDLTIVKVK